MINYTNSDGLPSQTRFDIKVSDVQLSGSPTPVSAVAGKSFSGPVANFTDANPFATASDFVATINWGDGTGTSAGTVTGTPSGFTISGSHAYANIGSYPTTITIADSGGASTVVHATATAGTVPSQVSTGKPPSVGGGTAAFTGLVNPSGLPTTAFFQGLL